MGFKEARAILGPKSIIGLSVETLEQAVKASQEEVDYLAASPIFNTNTKTDCNAPWGLKGLRELCSASKYPVVAIGGIHEANVKEVIDCGVAGLALVSAIFNSPCPKTAATTLRKRMQENVL